MYTIYAAYDAGSCDGKVGTLAIKDNKGFLAASGAGSDDRKVGTLALFEAGIDVGIGVRAKKIIRGREALKLYRQLEKKLHL